MAPTVDHGARTPAAPLLRRRPRTRAGRASGGVLLALVSALVLAGCSRQELDIPGALSPAGDAPSSSPVERQGPVPDGGAASCVEEYRPAAVAGRSFAFDGTVTGIGPGRTDRDGAGLPLAGVTFVVHEWFTGGEGGTVTVDMMSPEHTVATVDGESGPAYDVGTRLLVSGEPRWGGPPLVDAIAWGCGFTRYHSDVEADEWRAALQAG